MDRCHLKGAIGDRLHAVLCAAGYNPRWLLRAIARKGLETFFLALAAGTALGNPETLGPVVLTNQPPIFTVGPNRDSIEVSSQATITHGP